MHRRSLVVIASRVQRRRDFVSKSKGRDLVTVWSLALTLINRREYIVILGVVLPGPAVLCLMRARAALLRSEALQHRRTRALISPPGAAAIKSNVKCGLCGGRFCRSASRRRRKCGRMFLRVCITPAAVRAEKARQPRTALPNAGDGLTQTREPLSNEAARFLIGRHNRRRQRGDRGTGGRRRLQTGGLSGSAWSCRTDADAASCWRITRDKKQKGGEGG